MRKIVLAFGVALAIAGCTTAGNVEEQIKQVQAYTRLACSFIPTVETVAKILASGSAVDTASSVADAIFTAVTTIPLADGPGDGLPRVRGIVVKGYRVKA